MRCKCWAIALLIALVLGLAVLPLSKGRIDEALATQARQALERDGVQNVQVESDWATIIAKGPGAERNAALASIERIADRNAVDSVKYESTTDTSDPAQANEPDVQVAIGTPETKPRVRLTGTVPSTADKDALVTAAKKTYGDDQVTDEVTVKTEGSTSSNESVAGLAQVITAWSTDVQQANATLKGSALTISGSAVNADAAGKANAVVAQSRPGVKPSGTIASPEADLDGLSAAMKKAAPAPGITFVPSSTKFTPQALQVIKRVSAVLKKYPEGDIEISGHTDNQGAASTSKSLSEARASAVRQSLIGLGIDANRLTAVGRGEADPVATNRTEAGRLLNRRVEFTVQEN
ncbi:MAG: OmpA family protein [Actinomycetota bacterium]